MTLRSLASLALLFVFSTLSVSAQDGEQPLVGRIEGNRYISPTGAYSVEIPVLFELGGMVTDTDTVVTFRDGLSVHASIASFPMDATQRWEHETRGRKEYLIAFFTNFVQADFQAQFPGASVESARYIPAIQDGALLAFNLIPGGTMFADRIILASEDDAPVAKRGNLVFVKNEHVFILSIELAEKVLDRTTWDKKPAEEDDILRKRLTELLGKMTFPTPPSTPAK